MKEEERGAEDGEQNCGLSQTAEDKVAIENNPGGGLETIKLADARLSRHVPLPLEKNFSFDLSTPCPVFIPSRKA